MADSRWEDECTLRRVDRDCPLKKTTLVLASEHLPHKIPINPKGQHGDSQVSWQTDNHLDQVIELQHRESGCSEKSVASRLWRSCPEGMA